MAIILDGKATAAQIRSEVAAKTAALKERGIIPGLAVILVGDDPASRIYVNNKKKACAEVGFYSEEIALPATTTQEELLSVVDELNHRTDIHGIGRVALGLGVHDLQKPLKAGHAVLILLHKVDEGHDGGDKEVDRNDKGRILGEVDAAAVEEETAGNENDNVEHIGDEGGHGVELSHGLVGLATGGNEHSVALLEFLLLLIGVGEGLRNTDTRNTALK